MTRGRLRVYLGAAPGVGKTYAMLSEAHRQVDQGADCVIGFVEPHGRRPILRLSEGLETIRRRMVRYRGGVLPEMDVDAVLARNPQMVLVDELAHTNAPGSRNAKRWQDVEELLETGIDVLSTVNVQHLESLGDVLVRMTGVRQQETVPDAVVRQADELELVDLTPDALRRRMVAGDIYPPDRIDAALSHYFRPGNLTGLRELALLWLADRVDEGLQQYRAEHRISDAWEARERIVVGVSGGPETDALVRRAARLASRTPGSDLLAVHVARSDGRPGADPMELSASRALVESLGGSWHQVVGMQVSDALGRFARHENATQLVVGASRQAGWWALLNGRELVARRVTRLGPALDVHVVTDEQPARLSVRIPSMRGLGPRRRLVAVGLMMVLVPVVTWLLTRVRSEVMLPSDLLVYLLLVVTAAALGGLYPALATAVASVVAADWFLTRPLYTFRVAAGSDVVAFVVYLAAALLFGWFAEVGARQRRTAVRATAESAAVTAMAQAMLAGHDHGVLTRLLELLRETFGLSSVSLLERPPGTPPVGSGWQVVASSGQRPPERPGQADAQAVLSPSTVLAGRGAALSPTDLDIFTACAVQVVETVRQQQLAERARSAEHRADTEAGRVASAAAAARALADPVASSRATLAVLHRSAACEPGCAAETVTAALDSLGVDINRIAVLTGQLGDVARARGGALDVHLRRVDVAEVVVAALEELGPGHDAVTVAIPDDLPEVVADASVLTRVVAALMTEMVQHHSAGAVPAVTAQQDAGRVLIRFDIGTAAADSERDSGPGFSVQVARDLIEVIGGVLRIESGAQGASCTIVDLPATATHARADHRGGS